MPQISDKPAASDEEALQRFGRYESVDPFPSIQPALLNSADIYDYACATGIVHPFNGLPNDKKLKSASYEVDFLGELHYFCPDKGEYIKQTIRVGEAYTIKRNSIYYLFTGAVFRLPDYIAARFNLCITHVHAGLLLGTGPLIDPGFAGRLLIPLHNLTSNDYKIVGGAGIVWVEFTKLSENQRWVSGSSRNGKYYEFNKTKRYQSAATYFEKCSPGGIPVPARSSIPDLISSSATAAKEAEERAKHAEERASDAEETVKKYSIGISVAVFVSLCGVLLSVCNLIQGAYKNISDASNSVNKLEAKYSIDQQDITAKIHVLEAELSKLKKARIYNGRAHNSKDVVDLRIDLSASKQNAIGSKAVAP